MPSDALSIMRKRWMHMLKQYYVMSRDQKLLFGFYLFQFAVLCLIQEKTLMLIQSIVSDAVRILVLTLM